MGDDVRLVIDTDPGVDDAHAILMACRHPKASIAAISTVHGNVPLDQTTRNALSILELAGSDAPVFVGAAQPLAGPLIAASAVHGADGLGGHGRSPSIQPATDDSAAQVFIRLSHEEPGRLTFVMLGPLTNLALALSLDPGLPQRVRRLVVMGGAVRATGNASAVAEFNMLADPEAASIVFARWGSPIDLITWEATLAHPIEADRFDSIIGGPSDRAAFLRAIYDAPRAFVADAYGRTEVLVPDPLAMAVALEPAIVLEEQLGVIDMELGGRLRRGQTVLLPPWLTQRDANARIITSVEHGGLESLLGLAVR
jgi:purine nucleosidase